MFVELYESWLTDTHSIGGGVRSRPFMSCNHILTLNPRWPVVSLRLDCLRIRMSQ